MNHDTPADGRLGEPPAEQLLAHSLEPQLEAELGSLWAHVRVDMAHVVMLAEQQILAPDHAAELLQQLRQLDLMGPEGFHLDPKYGSLPFQIERFIAERSGEEVAGRIHTGRSRNDRSAAVNRLVARDRLLDVYSQLLDLQDVILTLAERHAATLMPGYTHLQAAQPTTFGHYLMRFYFTLERDQQRLQGAYSRTNLSALGGAAIAGTSWPLDRERVAQLLGHEKPVENSYDSGIFARDYPPENAAVLSILVNDCGRLAGDLYLWSATEFNMVQVADSLGGTSSIMPQKKNPHALERIRGLSGKAIGWLPSTLGMLHSTSSSDLGLFFGGDPILEMTDSTLSVLTLLRSSLESLEINEAAMRAKAAADWATTTNLADEIVRYAGLPFRRVHQIVGHLVKTALRDGISANEVTAKHVDYSAREIIGRSLHLPEELVRRALDPEEAIARLKTRGSAHPQRVAETVTLGREGQAHHRNWSGHQDARISSAADTFTDAVERLTLRRG